MIGSPLFLGIDPGVSGGMVALCGSTIQHTSFRGMNRYDVRNWIEDKAQWGQDAGCYAVIERVGGFIGGEDKQGKRKNLSSAHTAFVFGQSYGELRMCLACARITHREVLPKAWQKRYGMKREKGEKKERYKARLQSLAQSYVPEERITLAVSDALLLALYCRTLTWR